MEILKWHFSMFKLLLRNMFLYECQSTECWLVIPENAILKFKCNKINILLLIVKIKNRIIFLENIKIFIFENNWKIKGF